MTDCVNFIQVVFIQYLKVLKNWVFLIINSYNAKIQHDSYYNTIDISILRESKITVDKGISQTSVLTKIVNILLHIVMTMLELI